MLQWALSLFYLRLYKHGTGYDKQNAESKYTKDNINIFTRSNSTLASKVFYCQLVDTDAVVTPQLDGTVYDLFGSDSQVTEPELDTLMNLYSTVVPAGRLTVPVQMGLLLVYEPALRVIALDGFQLPRAEMLPTLETG